MGRATVRDLRYHFKDVEARLAQGEEIEVVKRRKIIAKLIPVQEEPKKIVWPDFMARIRKIHGDKVFEVTGADLVRMGRDRSEPIR